MYRWRLKIYLNHNSRSFFTEKKEIFLIEILYFNVQANIIRAKLWHRAGYLSRKAWLRFGERHSIRNTDQRQVSPSSKRMSVNHFSISHNLFLPMREVHLLWAVLH